MERNYKDKMQRKAEDKEDFIIFDRQEMDREVQAERKNPFAKSYEKRKVDAILSGIRGRH